MLEIIALIFLTKETGRIAERKGLKPTAWKIYTVVAWVISEIIGVFFGLMIFGGNNIVSVLLVAIMFALTSFFIIKAHLNKLPDQSFDDDINNLGRF